MLGVAPPVPDPETWQLNEAVNFDLECIFVAVPKTGTTSVRSQIRPNGPYLIPRRHLNIVEIRDTLFAFLLLRATSNNHSFPTEDVARTRDVRLEADEVFRNFFKFCSVRNPWARAVSLYFRKEGVQVADRMSFEEFCLGHVSASDTCQHPTLHSNQIDWMTDEAGQILVDYVYKMEDFATAVGEIRELTNGRLKLQALEKNRNAASRSRDYRDMFSARARNAIARAFEKDIDYFKYAF